jgi:hypothetical protein
MQATGISANVHKKDGKWVASFGAQGDYELKLAGNSVALVTKQGNRITTIYPTYDPVTKTYAYRLNNAPFRISETDYSELLMRVSPQPTCGRP